MRLAPMLNRFVPLFFFAMLGASASQAAAQDHQCGVNPARILQIAYPEGTKGTDQTFLAEGGSIRLPSATSADYTSDMMVCRIWPAHPHYRLVAVPIIYAQSPDGRDGDIDLLVLDSRTDAIVARNRFADLASDDAIRIHSVAFDTAYYALAPDRVAFGLRVIEAGSSQANPFGLTTLWLFELEGEKLTTIVDRLIVAASGGEWDTDCVGKFHATTRTLAMAPRTGAAIADIVVSSRSETSTAHQRDGTCTQTVTHTAPDPVRLVFEGGNYSLPDGLTRQW